MADFDRLPGESAQAYKAFTIYRGLPPGERSLARVSREIALERRGGLIFLKEGENSDRALKGH